MKKKKIRGAGKLKPIFLRKVRNIKGQLCFSLPKPFCTLYGVREGDLLAVIISGSTMQIRPIGKELLDEKDDFHA